MVRFSDFTDTLYTFFYRDTACQVMDTSAEQLKMFKSEGDNQSYQDAFTRQQYKKYKILMRARISTYAGGTKVSYSAAKVMPFDTKHENSLMLDRLDIYEQRKDLSEMQQDMAVYDIHQEANFYGNGRINSFVGSAPSQFSYHATM